MSENDGDTVLCRVCRATVWYSDMRQHLCEHRAHAEDMEWEDVRNQFWPGPPIDEGAERPA